MGETALVRQRGENELDETSGIMMRLGYIGYLLGISAGFLCVLFCISSLFCSFFLSLYKMHFCKSADLNVAF